jgi:uncharacterized protein (TIGR00255 family)
MTGFGKGLAEDRMGTIKIEIKSLNYKFFEVVSKLPANLTIFEDKIREVLQKKISRGRLSLFLNYERKSGSGDEVYIDKKTGKKYYDRIRDLKRYLRLGGEIKIEQIIPLPGVIAYRPQDDNAEKLWPVINKALNSAIEGLVESKAEEGRMIKKNIRKIIDSIEISLGKIKLRTPMVVKDYKKRLIENVKDLTKSNRVFNPGRIEEEAAIFARNCDISEEIHRVSAHISSFKKVLLDGGEAGRQLDFIAQEMHREANTIGAKANDFPISKEIIKIKSLIEKIREQVQNVE